MEAHPHSPHEAPHPILRNLAHLLCITVLAMGGFGFVPAAASSSGAQFFVESTGHVLADPFLRYWVDNDGERLLGLPVSEIAEVEGRPTQFFQYGALSQEANASVSRRMAGVELLDSLQRDSTLLGGRRTPSSRTSSGGPSPRDAEQALSDESLLEFPIDAELLPYWQQWGGAGTLGNPISPAYQQAGHRAQWFEFGRIELGPGGAMLAEVGRELGLRLSVPTSPVARGDLPLFDPSRFATFHGDGVIPNEDEPFDPVRLQIPKIKVDARIEVTTVQDGVMTNPVDPWKAGWYQSFSRPGEWSNTVVSGHRDWWGYGPVVFWDLGWLQPGDKVYLTGAEGSGAAYVVSEVLVVPRTVDPQTIIGDIGYEALTLITCGGVWTGTEYTDRIIIRAYRI